jgi:hypothetical protein
MIRRVAKAAVLLAALGLAGAATAAAPAQLMANTPTPADPGAAHQARIGSQTFTMRELEEWEPACEMRADLIDNTIALPPTP